MQTDLEALAKGQRKCERCDNHVNYRHGTLCSACIVDDYDDYDDEPEMDEDERFLEFNCGMMPDGGCLLANNHTGKAPAGVVAARPRLAR